MIEVNKKIAEILASKAKAEQDLAEAQGKYKEAIAKAEQIHLKEKEDWDSKLRELESVLHGDHGVEQSERRHSPNRPK